jgi:hypothetical protein
MTEQEIIEAATQEIDLKSWGVTEQFLKIHSLVFQDGKPIITRIDRDYPDGSAIVYFPVHGEKFHLAITVAANPILSVIGIEAQPYTSVYFQASSDTLDLGQLSALTQLKPTSGWNKGEKRGLGSAFHRVSCIRFEPNPEPDAFEDKMGKLLKYLESDAEGVKRLVVAAEGYIQAAMIFHNGNTMLGGAAIGKETLKRMADLDLAIDFDLYAEGKFYR